MSKEKLQETLEVVRDRSDVNVTVRMRAALALCALELESQETVHSSRIAMIAAIINGEK